MSERTSEVKTAPIDEIIVYCWLGFAAGIATAIAVHDFSKVKPSGVAAQNASYEIHRQAKDPLNIGAADVGALAMQYYDKDKNGRLDDQELVDYAYALAAENVTMRKAFSDKDYILTHPPLTPEQKTQK